MKRLYVAIALIVISLSFAVSEYILIQKSYKDFYPVIEKAEKYCSEKEFSDAFKTINYAQTEWDKKSKLLNSFIDHTHTENINENYFQLLEMAQKKEDVEFLSLCEKTKRQLLSLKESELPSFDNIM